MSTGGGGLWAMEPAAVLRTAGGLGASRLEKLDRRTGLAGFPDSGSGGGGGWYAVASGGSGVARIAIDGPICFSPAPWELAMGLCVATGALVEAVNRAADDAAVKVLLLDVHSPGGSVDGMADLVAAVRRAASIKPVVALVRDRAASAAYWAIAYCTRILATRTAMVGCLGVYTALVDSSKQAEMYGLKVEVVGSGELKGAGVPGTPVTEAQRAEQKRLAMASAGLFFADVAGGRKLKPEAVAALDDGRMLTAEESLAAGLVDEVIETGEAALPLVAAMAATVTGKTTQRSARVATAGVRRMAKVTRADLEAMDGGPELIDEIRNDAAKAAKAAVAADGGDAKAAASLDQLQAAFPGQAEFVLKALNGKMTLAAAMTEQIGLLRAQVAAATDGKTKAEADLAEARKAIGAGARGGREALQHSEAGGGGATPGADGQHPFMAKVAEIQAGQQGMTRSAATREAIVKHPDLHRQYLAANVRKDG